MKIPEPLLRNLMIGMGSASLFLGTACDSAMTIKSVPATPKGSTSVPSVNASTVKPDLDNKECPSLILSPQPAVPTPFIRVRYSCDGCGMG